MLRKMKVHPLDILVVGLFLLAAGWVYSGFFHPDPLYVNADRSGSLTMLSKLLKIAFPIVAGAVTLFYLLARAGVIAPLQVALSLTGLVIGGGALFVAAAEFYYFKTANRSTDEYHTYLQLRPPALAPKADAEGQNSERIICLGGSTTAWGDSAGKHWTEMLETEINRGHPDRGVTISNQGKEWYTSLHSLINYETNLRQTKPGTLLVMHAINDLMHNADFGAFSNGEFRNDYGHYLGPATTLVKRHMFEGIISANWKHLWNHAPRREITTAEFPGLPAFKRNLETIADLAAVDGTKVVFLTEPYIFREKMSKEELDVLAMLNTEAIGEDRQWTLATILEGMRQYDAAVRSLAGYKGARVIDLEAAVPKSLEYFKDDVHYTDKTFPLIAAAIAREISGETAK